TRRSLPPIVEKNWRQKLPGGSPQGCEMPGRAGEVRAFGGRRTAQGGGVGCKRRHGGLGRKGFARRRKGGQTLLAPEAAMRDKQAVLEGIVERITFRNEENGYTVLRLMPSGRRADAADAVGRDSFAPHAARQGALKARTSV